MDRIRQILEALTNENGILSVLHFIPMFLFSISHIGKQRGEPEFLGDNAPYALIDSLNRRGE